MKTHYYESLEAQLKDNDEIEPGKIQDSVKRSEYSFFGTESYEKSLEIARKGCDLERVEALIYKLEKTENVMRATPEWNVTGAVVDIGAFLSGEPECMIDFPITVDLKFIRVFVDVCENAATGSEVFNNKAAAAAYAVDFLENHGYRVKLDACFGTTHGLFASTTIKDYQEKLSIGQLAGCMHVGYFRRICFRSIEKHTHNPKGNGYGNVFGGDSNVKEMLREITNDNEVIYLPNTSFGKPNFNLNRIEEAKKWAEHHMNHKMILR